MKKFNFKLKDGTTKTMEFDELVRWACLIEALEVVGRQEDVDIDISLKSSNCCSSDSNSRVRLSTLFIFKEETTNAIRN